MPYKKGQPRPLGAGRKAGTKNVRRSVAQALAEKGIDCIDEITYWYKKLDPDNPKDVHKAIDTMLDLLQYDYAKMKTLEVSGTVEIDNKIQVQVLLPDNKRKAIDVLPVEKLPIKN